MLKLGKRARGHSVSITKTSMHLMTSNQYMHLWTSSKIETEILEIARFLERLWCIKIKKKDTVC